MAINKNFVVKNGFEASTDLIVADAVTRRVGVGTTVATHTLHVNGGIGATTIVVSGIGTFTNELNVGSNGSVLTALGIGGSVGIGSALPSYLLDVRSPVSTGQTALYVFGDAEFTGIINANAVDFANLIVSGIATFNNVNFQGYVSAGNTIGINNQVLVSTGAGVTWKDTGSLRTTTTFIATAAQTTFSVVYNLTTSLDVFVNGVKLANTEFTATSGTNVILDNGCFNGDVVEIITYDIDFPLNFTGITIKEEGSLLANNVNTLNFVGLAITAIATSGSASTISIDAQPPLNSGSQVTVGIITATSFVGDGSGLTGIIASGTGIIIRDDGALVGTASTIDFGTNLSVSAISAGVVTVTAAGGGGSSQFVTTAAGIHTLSNVGIGTTNPRFTLEVGAVGASGTTLFVNGDARVTGIVTIGPASITLNGSTNIINVGTGITINGSTGIISATAIVLGGTTLTGAAVTFITAGSGISVNQGTGNVTITATGGGSSQFVTTAAGIHTLSNVGIGTTNPTSKLTITGDVLATGVVTATTFIGALTGNASSATFATSAGIATYATSAGIATYATNAGVSTYATSAGIATYATNAGIATYATSAGIATYATNAGIATYATSAGIATYTSEWILGAVGSSDYTFTGPGLIGAESDPVLYLVRGQQYKFTNTMGAHPFRIQSTVNGSTGTAYNEGIANNDVSNGTLTWNVQFDAPNILYYQCTAHGGMGGKIYIIDAGIGPDISINTTGIITASSFSGNASSATFATSAGIATYASTAGISTVAQNLTGSPNITVSSVNSSGIITASSFSGSNTLKIRTTITGVTTSITNNGIGNTDITGFKSYALMKVGLSTAGWLRLYTDSTSRTNDASRSVGIDPTPGSGVIAEVVTTGITTTQIITPFVMGGNLNNPADTTIYAAITNLSGVTTSISAQLTLLQLEA